MSERDLGRWLEAEHPNITQELFMGVPEGDLERMEALRSSAAMEAWVKRHYPQIHAEWKAGAGGESGAG